MDQVAVSAPASDWPGSGRRGKEGQSTREIQALTAACVSLHNDLRRSKSMEQNNIVFPVILFGVSDFEKLCVSTLIINITTP